MQIEKVLQELSDMFCLGARYVRNRSGQSCI